MKKLDSAWRKPLSPWAALFASLFLLGALTFGLTSAGGAANGKVYTDGIAPSSAPAGSTQSYSFTITNDPASGSNTIGSANVTVPSAFTNLALTTPPVGSVSTNPAGKNWTATLNGNVIQLRSGKQSTNGLTTTQSVTVYFSATAPCVATATDYQFAAAVKQSNDFSGSDPSNIFQLSGNPATVTVTPGGGPATQLAFTTAAQTFTAGGSSGTITVQRRNACGGPATQGSTNLTLSSTSAAGSFSTGSTPTIADGSSDLSFTYSDTKGYELVGGVKTPPGYPTITASATGLTSVSQQETVNPQTVVSSLEFSTQPPSWVVKNTSFNVGVTAYDQYGNPVAGHTVTLAMGNNPNGATLTCTPSNCQATTNSVGVATFTLSLDKDSVGFTLTATGSPSVNSNAFNVADQIADCGHANCTPSGSDGLGSTTNSSVAGFTGQAAIAVDGSLQARLDLCGGSPQQVGPGTVFEGFNFGTSDAPSWQLTMQVDKSELINPSRGAAQYDVCLGTKNISPGQHDATTCNPNGTTISNSASWPAKGGGCALPDANGVYWGNVPDAPSSVKKCSQALSPVVLSKNKTNAGDLVITFCVPYPWDGAGGFHSRRT